MYSKNSFELVDAIRVSKRIIVLIVLFAIKRSWCTSNFETVQKLVHQPQIKRPCYFITKNISSQDIIIWLIN